MNAGSGLAVSLSLSSEGGLIAQTVVLQGMAMLMLTGAMFLAKGATNVKRFPLLMLMIYFQVDFFQTSLLLNSDFASKEFWIMIFIGEVSSFVKNCGMVPFVSYLLCIRKTNPFTDDVHMAALEKKGLVDSISEIQTGFGVATVFIFEKEVRSLDGINMFNVTVSPLLNMTDSYFITEGCGLTCP